MNAIAEAALANSLAEAVDVEVSNVVGFKRKAAPAASLDEHAAFHRAAAAEYDERRAVARRDAKAAALAFKSERAKLRAQFDADMADIGRREEESRAQTALRIKTAEILGKVERAAVREIEQAE